MMGALWAPVVLCGVLGYGRAAHALMWRWDAMHACPIDWLVYYDLRDPARGQEL